MSSTMYATGTVAVTNGSPNIVGTGTAWVKNAKPGQGILIINGTRFDTIPIYDVTADGAIVLQFNYPGTTASGLTYCILPFVQYAIDAANALASAQLAFQAYTGLAPSDGNYLRYIGSPAVPTIQTSQQVITDLLTNIAEVNVASASTTDIGAASSPRSQITSTNAIASLGLTKNAMRWARFAGSLTMTNSSTLVLPGAVDLLTAANDVGLLTSDGSTTPVWRLASYLRANGTLAPFIAGSAATPAFTFPGDTNTGLFNPVADTVAVGAGGAEVTRTDTTGLRVLTAVKNGALTVAGAIMAEADNTRDLGSASFQFRSAYLGTSLVFLGTTVSAKTGSGSLVLSANPTLTGTLTAAVIAMSGALTFNGAAATTSNAFTTTGSTTGATYADFTNTGGTLRLGVERSTGGILATSTSAYASVVGTSGATSLQLITNGAVVHTITSGAIVLVQSSLGFGTSSSTAFPLLMNAAEVARLGTDGSLLVGLTSNAGAGCLGIANNLIVGTGGSANRSVRIEHATGSTGSADFLFFTYNASQIGGISQVGSPGTGVAFNTTSDARLKTRLSDQRDFRSIIANIDVADAEWKGSPGSRNLVVFAQQAYEHYPDAITRPADDADMWQADYGKLAPLALWGVKDLYATKADVSELDVLRARVTELERKAA